MKASLQLKLGQQLTMTPQLQQAIRLLQLSTLDLQQEIQEALDSNMMLEIEDDSNPPANETESSSTESSADQSGDSSGQANDELTNTGSDTDPGMTGETPQTAAGETDFEIGEEWSSNSIPDDLPVDTAWDDIYQNAPTNVGSVPDDDVDYDSRNSASETLQDHLCWQLNLTPMTETDNAIAMAIIDSINPDGYLSVSIEEIHAGLTGEIEDIDLDEVAAVLRRVQHFDPPGVASRNLQECLLIQLGQLPEDTPWLPQAKLVVSHYLSQLGNRDYAQLMRRSRLKEEALKCVIQLIQSLSPRPGEAISTVKPEYIVPDVIVKKENGRWKIELNAEVSPKIRVNQQYASLVKRADSSADNTFLKDHLQEAKWFIKSLQSRNETLLKVATKIVEYQQGFLDYGDEAMKPMVLHDIASAVDMHESTISRVTTQKYMHTPRGVFELKYFFSSHVSTTGGGECSSTAIRAIIKKLVAAESPKKPLSDSKIAGILDEQGIKVARRTIAKYREAMSIPPSNERKRLL
ncbi:MAG: RNA polymerase factor sigma-54 [Gammaproteobacteria bacterium]|nr:MAG: RNA polymerase factor sigma-54 [Pseudomonadota bacterium]PIE38251.1 MAG: RNA polymerase factor sigma-54 [Gammaproteobacteria bacterium]